MRVLSKTSTARCHLSLYTNYIISEAKRVSCVHLSEIMSISHESVNRFLRREDYNPLDLFNQVKEQITLEGGFLSVDDTIIDKDYSPPPP